MSVEVLRCLPEQPTAKPPLLFVHGAWHAAWCWTEHFLPYFADRGYPAYALSLRAHGKSPGKLKWASLSDYVADVTEAVDRIPTSPILIGHSMGGGVVQKYLETRDAPGAVLLASMPPYGILPRMLKFSRSHPLKFLRANLTMSFKCLVSAPELAREYFFSPSLPPEDLARFLGLLQDESYRAFLDMIALDLPNPERVQTPMLVLGAENDTIFSPADILETALRYEADMRILSGLAHDMMLDTRWRDAADAIAAWLDSRWGRSSLSSQPPAKVLQASFGALRKAG